MNLVEWLIGLLQQQVGVEERQSGRRGNPVSVL
jgi:hypothetical protein